jgi:hypothetical protein
MHFSSRNSAFSHDNVINLLCQRCLSGGGLTLIARRFGFMTTAPVLRDQTRVWLDCSKYIARGGNARSGEGNFGGGVPSAAELLEMRRAARASK